MLGVHMMLTANRKNLVQAQQHHAALIFDESQPTLRNHVVNHQPACIHKLPHHLERLLPGDPLLSNYDSVTGQDGKYYLAWIIRIRECS